MNKLFGSIDSQLYHENTCDDMGVKHTWYNAEVKDSFITNKGTHVEMVARPKWGIACYMDNAIQSCEVDEKLYHETLVHPVMSSADNAKKIMIIGGGEGATLREVLKWNTVEKVDMYEWDKDVVDLFKKKYPQWAQGAWNDPRVTLYYEDIFEVIVKTPRDVYDVIIIDLFDPCDENVVQWYILLKSLQYWVSTAGSIVMYSGIRNILVKSQPYHILYAIMTEHKELVNSMLINKLLIDKEIIPYKVFIPSFSGESTFLLIKSVNTSTDSMFNVDNVDNVATVSNVANVSMHLTNDIWNSYKTFNW